MKGQRKGFDVVFKFKALSEKLNKLMITLRTATGYPGKCTLKDQFQEKSELCLALSWENGLVKL